CALDGDRVDRVLDAPRVEDVLLRVLDDLQPEGLVRCGRCHDPILLRPRYALTVTDVVEAPAAVKAISHWVGGRAVPGLSGRSGAVYNPATGLQSGAVDFASVAEVDAAVQAAK